MGQKVVTAHTAFSGDFGCARRTFFLGAFRWLALAMASMAVSVVVAALPSTAAPAAASTKAGPSVSGAQLAALNAQRRRLFKRMMANPTNIPISLRYARLSSRTGHLEAAIATLERLSLYAPDLARLKLDLGGLYYRLGAYNQARVYLKNALNGSKPAPPDVRTKAQHYLSLIRTHQGNQTHHQTHQGKGS